MARGLPPFECAVLTRPSVCRKFWGCCATQRGQAPSPHFAPAGRGGLSRRWRLLRGCFNAVVEHPDHSSGRRRSGGEQTDPVALRARPGR
ncbi:hypothetical protein C9I50_00025 [Pseudomonas prosekii]|nr:hypothetical protein C9I50_00025 [Pseudomonas prosekii]